MNKTDAYSILNIEQNELLTELLLKTKYRKACLKCHPDKPGGTSGSFIKVKEAHDYLKNEDNSKINYSELFEQSNFKHQLTSPT